MTKNIVAVFNTDWQVTAWVDESLAPAPSLPTEAVWVLGQLADRDPQLQQPIKDEHGCAIGLTSVPKGDERYMEAVRDELRRVSLRAHVVNVGLKDDLEAISAQNFDANIRMQIVPDIIGLPIDQAQAALQAVLAK